jgi:HEPN domain-containing protein
VCYLCQQSAEKILKAYNIAKENKLTKTHILGDLLNTCEQYSPDFNVLLEPCAKLTPYIALSRYPSGIDITDYDMKQALNNAGKILEFTKSKLQELGFVPEAEPTQN